ncbi:VPLPA-CTERM sorting domain-containing protein [Methylophilus glucosoxydans]|uniref:VPLPA-CTERM sorting domain-containing protein n=1 Tax=Methylophilus glucosoxydans TaxID=752553 RepID=A0ABW3GJV5_9PROT
MPGLYLYKSIKFSFSGLLISLAAFSTNSNAALKSYTTNGVDLVYSSVSDVTWMKDANLLKTMMASDSSLVNKILSASPKLIFEYGNSSYYDPLDGFAKLGYKVTTSDFKADGQATWFGANLFINYLNTINYAGTNNWQLPTFSNKWLTGQGPNYPVHNEPSNGTAKGDEFIELFYSELNSTPAYSKGESPSFDPPNPNAGFNNSNNIFTLAQQSSSFWSGTESPAPEFYCNNGDNCLAKAFTDDGGSFAMLKQNFSYVWANTQGQISAVPAPAAAWLFATGLPIVAAAARRKKQSV